MARAELPPPGAGEIAFVGRSNVGKSSLLNALTGRRALARTSAQPGRTRQLNFFSLDDRLLLVDLPGYGYAEASAAAKHAWQELMFAYLRGRPTLLRVLLLLDARIGCKANDHEAMALLDRAAVVYQLVLTKIDAVAAEVLAGRRAELEALAVRHPAALPLVLAASSRSGAGIAELRATLADLVTQADDDARA
jgi:GTP-binding protein